MITTSQLTLLNIIEYIEKNFVFQNDFGYELPYYKNILNAAIWLKNNQDYDFPILIPWLTFRKKVFVWRDNKNVLCANGSIAVYNVYKYLQIVPNINFLDLSTMQIVKKSNFVPLRCRR